VRRRRGPNVDIDVDIDSRASRPRDADPSSWWQLIDPLPAIGTPLLLMLLT